MTEYSLKEGAALGSYLVEWLRKGMALCPKYHHCAGQNTLQQAELEWLYDLGNVDVVCCTNHPYQLKKMKCHLHGDG